MAQSSRGLKRYIYDTARFDERISGWHRDDRYREAGGTIVYSIDTEMFYFYVNRRKESSGPHGYTTIYKGDPKEISQAIGEYIAEAIFFESSHQATPFDTARHLLLLPGLDDEFLDAIQNIITSQLEVAEAARVEISKTGQTILRKVSEKDGDAAKLEYVKKHLGSLFSIFFGEDNIVEKAGRLKKVANEASLTPLLRLHLGMFNRFPPALIEEAAHAEDYTSQARLRAYQSLSAILKPREGTDPRSHERDLQALSWLVALNAALAPKGVRIVHVTAASRLLSDCRQLYLLEDGTLSNQYVHGRMNLADAFLRHPLAFWMSPDVSRQIASVEGNSEFAAHKLTEWITPLIPSWLKQSKFPLPDSVMRQIGRSVAFALKNNSQVLTNFERKWSDFSVNLVATQALALGKHSPSATEILRDINSSFSRNFDELLDGGAMLGLAVTSSKRRSLRSRLLPPVVLSGLSDALSKMIGDLHNPVTDEHFEENILAFTRLSRARLDRYVFYIGTALLFAREKQFKAATAFAQRAVSTADEAKDSGREGLLLLAALTRLTAQRLDDLDKARLILLTAEQALRDDVRKGITGISPVRFKGERLALDLSRLMFAKFLGLRLPTGEGYIRRNIVDQVRQVFASELGDAEREYESDIKNRAYTNLFSLMLHDEATFTHATKNAESMRAWQSDFKDWIKIRNSQTASYLHQAVFTAAECVLGLKDGSRSEVCKQLDEFYSQSTIDAHLVTRYDSYRYQELRDRAYAAFGTSKGN